MWSLGSNATRHVTVSRVYIYPSREPTTGNFFTAYKIWQILEKTEKKSGSKVQENTKKPVTPKWKSPKKAGNQEKNAKENIKENEKKRQSSSKVRTVITKWNSII